MWIVEKSPSVTNWKTVFRSGNEAKAREILERQVQVHCTGKFRLVDPAGNVVEMKYARSLFATA